MIIDAKRSLYLHKVEKRIKNNNFFKSKYMILKIDIKAPMGLFAYYIRFCSEIDYAISNGYIPVVDMQYFDNDFHSGEYKKGKSNSWELFFEQPYGISVDEALKSKSCRYYWKDNPPYHPNDSLDFLYCDEIINYYHGITEKYMKFNSKTKDFVEKAYDKYIKSKVGDDTKIIGVLARGTDYTNGKPFYHPVQPTLQMMFEQIDEWRDRYGIKKVYVATEDEDMLKAYLEKYGDDLLFVNQKRVSLKSGFLCKNTDFMDRDPFIRGAEYLSSIYCLSKCNMLVAGRTSGTVGACLMSEGFEKKQIFTLGRYGIEDAILDHTYKHP